ncbi:MAG: NAD(P)-dependent alcohol dehydrogenase [Ignavibacteria bacterium]|nr:NAD(P)-dependent alcohol dehydrogenase [Ignavibacteria bacterium]
MKAAICTKYGPPEVFKIVERDVPVPNDDEVLIKVFAASVTNSDIFIRSSDIPLRFRIPMRIMIGITRPRNDILGEVLSGEIVQVGSKIRRFQVGDQIFGLTGFSLGAYADYKCMKETDSKQGCIALKPRNIGFEDATSAAYGGLLALQFLEQAHIQPKQKVLIYGASGTSGTIAVQYAKHLGAEVTGVCSTEKIDLVKSLGADKTLDYTHKDSLAKLEEYNYVLDAVGKARTSELKQACRARMSDKHKFLSIDDSALICSSERLGRIRELIESGVVKPITDKCFPLEHIIDAHRYVEQGHKKGNVAIKVN